jgi:chromosome segregation ATPase
MNTDTLREKFIRSEEALSRLGDDTKQLVFTRVQDLRGTRDYLETLIKEKEAVDTQITEQEAKISSLQDEINNQANLKEELVRKQAETAQELQAKNVRFEELQIEINETSETLQSTTNEIEKLKTEISQKRDKIATLTKTNQELELKLKSEIETKEAENRELRTNLETLKSENAVISFLLEESAEDLPEVDILAAVMNLGTTTKEQLKQTLEGQISPVIITRTLGRMAEKNLLNFNESNETISIK